MAKILNLDELSLAEGRQIKLLGETHDVKEMDVDDFVETSKAAAKLEDKEVKLSIEQQMDITVDLIHRLVPTLDKSKLRKIDLHKLAAISLFVRGIDVVGTKDDKDAPAPEAASGEEAGK